MKKTRFSEEQMVTILREADTKPVLDVAEEARRHCQLVEGSALLPREIDAPDRSQQAHVTASHSTNAYCPKTRSWG